MDSDGVPTFYLDCAGGKEVGSKKPGGFQHLYPVINVPAAAASQMEQKRCIFAMTPSHFVKVAGHRGDQLTAAVLTQVRLLYARTR